MLRRVMLLAAIAFFVAMAKLWAHDLGAEVRLRGDQIEVQAFFDDGSPARQARVELLHPESKLPLASARTDAHGRAWLLRPAAGSYLIRINAGAGHIHEEAITVPAANANLSTAAMAVATDADEDDVLLSRGPTYDERTQFPWLKLVFGLLAIGGMALAAYGVLRQSRSSHSTAS
ncbi:hypothetical protein HRbin36_02633 [bacterium HR36]|nr:hypothetical protein HRbin36_02633 [bacterium HR36]